MSVTLSPNMSLPVPGVGTEAGPTYATDINSCMSILDQHNHSAGSGVQINPSGININAALTLNNNFLTAAAGVTLQAQGGPPANNTIYKFGVDLYYVDGLGNNVRITQSGGVAGSPGSISNLTSPASASYVSGSQTFVWQSGASIAANLDAGSILLRNLSPNSTNALTLSPPAALSSNYTLTLPNIPGQLSFMTMDSSGNMGSLTETGGITGSMIAAATISRSNLVAVGQQVSASCNSFTTTSSGLVDVTNLGVTITTTGRPVIITLIGDGNSSSYVRPQNTFSIFAFTRNNGVISYMTAGTSVGASSSFYPPGCFTHIDVVIAGTYTYKFQASSGDGSSTTNVADIKLVAYEL